MNELERHEAAAMKPGTSNAPHSPGAPHNPTTPQAAGATRMPGTPGVGSVSHTTSPPSAPGTSAPKSQLAGAPQGRPGADKPDLKQAASAARDAAQGVGEAAQDTLDDVRRRASEVYEDAADVARDGYEKLARGASRIRHAAPGSASQAGRMATHFVEDNPVMVGVVGLAAGLILGSILPGTRRENRVFGRYADDVRGQGLRYARDLAEQGKHYVEESLQPARKG